MCRHIPYHGSLIITRQRQQGFEPQAVGDHHWFPLKALGDNRRRTDQTSRGSPEEHSATERRAANERWRTPSGMNLGQCYVYSLDIIETRTLRQVTRKLSSSATSCGGGDLPEGFAQGGTPEPRPDETADGLARGGTCDEAGHSLSPPRMRGLPGRRRVPSAEEHPL